METDTPRTDHSAYSADQLSEWLLVNASQMSPAQTAALTLLIKHRVWLLRPDFRRIAVVLDDDDPQAVTCARIDFDRAVQAVQAWRAHEQRGGPVGEICLDHSIGDGAVEVLMFADVLWFGKINGGHLKAANIRLAVEAIAHACGKELLGGELVDLKI